MAADACVLLLGDHEVRLSDWAERIRALGFRPVRAKTTQDALVLADERGHRFRVALVESEMPAYDLRGALECLRQHPCSLDLRFVAFGPRPDSGGLELLRAAGIERALWDPVGDHTLRFELNRAFAKPDVSRSRGELRIPTEWSARIFVAGRQKPGLLYTLSAVGAFVETPRPSMRGARAVLELPLPDGPLRVAGKVLYANVPGNLEKKNLPTGMALRFEDSTAEQTQRLRNAILTECDTRAL